MARRFADIAESLGLTPGRAEAVGQGLTFGLGDELGAGLQAGMAAVTPGMNAAETYRTARNENRDILHKEQEAEPLTAAALELAGSVPTTAALPVGRLVGTVAKDAKFVAALPGAVPKLEGVWKAAKAAAPAGMLYGYGKSEEETPEGQAEDTALGGLGAAGLAGAGRAAVNAGLQAPAIRRLLAEMQRRKVYEKAKASLESLGASGAPQPTTPPTWTPEELAWAQRENWRRAGLLPGAKPAASPMADTVSWKK